MSATQANQRTPLMKVPEVADLFGVDPETVRVWARVGKLRARRNPGGRVLVFRRVDVYALFNDADAALESDPIAQNESGPALATATPDEPLTDRPLQEVRP